MSISISILWIILAVIFVIVEAITVGLLTIWFTVGAVVAAVMDFFGAPIWAQIIVFFAVSLLLLAFTRPILVKKLKVGRYKNNVELIEGKSALVTEAIEPYQSGLVKVNGIIWTAIGETPTARIAANTQVSVVRIEGVKLIVKPANV